MDKINGENTAFPAGGEGYEPTPGMTYRQWLVGQAISGLTANTDFDPGKVTPIAQRAIDVADAIIFKMNN